MVKLTRNSYIKIALIALLCLAICTSLGRCSTYATCETGSGRMAPAAPSAPSAPNAPALADTISFDAEVSRQEVNPLDARSLCIQWAAGRVTVQTAPDSENNGMIVVAERTSASAKRFQPLRMEVADGMLSINSGETIWNPWWGCSSLASKALEVTIPESAAAKLELVEVDGASGTYNLAGFSCKQLSVALASGMLETSDITAQNLHTDIASGQVQFRGSFPQSLDVTVASGSLAITDTGDTFPQRIDADIMSGNVTLALAPEGGFTADVDRLSGNFSCGYASSQQNGRYIYGDGKSEVEITLTSGNMELIPRS